MPMHPQAHRDVHFARTLALFAHGSEPESIQSQLCDSAGRREASLSSPQASSARCSAAATCWSEGKVEE